LCGLLGCLNHPKSGGFQFYQLKNVNEKAQLCENTYSRDKEGYRSLTSKGAETEKIFQTKIERRRAHQIRSCKYTKCIQKV
jgi:hypothetical protein